MRLKLLAAPVGVLAAAGALLGPAPLGQGYSLLGSELVLGLRHTRVFNNFGKAITNDNLTPDDNFPGHQGAVMAIWKGCAEWSSELHGSGNGDPTQPGSLGSGGANFDPSFQGEANGVGIVGSNIHSQIGGEMGGVLAFTESVTGGGWRIRYYEVWDWEDGPGQADFTEKDLQGVAAHEYGHALGLDHSLVPGTTMFATVSGPGNEQRSIEADDVAGLKAIYGAKAPLKPRIDAIEISGATLTLRGKNFAPQGNQVWFTRAGVTSTGVDPVVRVANLSSSDGITLSLNIPLEAGPGDVLVQSAGSSHSSLSNPWPFDPAGVPPAPVVTGVTPGQVPLLGFVAPVITLSGAHLETTLEVKVDGQPVTYSLSPDHELSLQLPPPAGLGSIDLAVETLTGTGGAQVAVVPNDPPFVEVSEALLFPGQTTELTLSATPGMTLLLAASFFDTPSVLPGLISADIGAGFSSLFLLGTFGVPDTGLIQVPLSAAGIPGLSTLFFQVAGLDASGPPLVVSNVVTVLVI